MARPKKPTELASFGPPVGAMPLPVQGSAVFVSEPERSATEERRDRELDEILDTLGSDGQVIVYHVIDGKTTYAGNMTMSGFSLGALMDNYGGGDKTLVFMQGNKRVDTIRISLDPSIPFTSPRAKDLAKQAHVPGNAPLAAAPAVGIDLPALITAQASQFSAILQANQQQSSLMMTTLMGLLTAAMGNKTDPTESFVRLLAIMKESGAVGGGGVGPDQMLSLIDKGMAIGARMNGNEDDVMGMVGKGLDTLGTIVTAMVHKRPNATPGAVPALPVPVVPEVLTGVVQTGPVPTAQPATTHEENGMSKKPAPPAPSAVPIIRPWVDALRPFVPMIVGAVGRMDPTQAADIVAGQLDEAQLDDMITDIKAPDFAPRLGTYYPDEIAAITSVDGGAEWLGAVLESILEYDNDGAEGTTPEPEAVEGD